MSRAKQEMTLAGSVLSALFSVSSPWAPPLVMTTTSLLQELARSCGGRLNGMARVRLRSTTTREPGGDPLPPLLLIVECFTPLVIPAFTPLISRAMSCSCVELRGREIGCGYNRCWPCRPSRVVTRFCCAWSQPAIFATTVAAILPPLPLFLILVSCTRSRYRGCTPHY